MIVEHLNQAYAARPPDREFRISPSNLGGCMRQLAFLLNGLEPEPVSPESQRVFELGHQRGEALEAVAKAVWPDARSQVPIRIPLGKYELRGTLDLWIPSLRTIVDFKTVGAYGATLLGKEGPSEEYQIQVHAYRDGLASASALLGCELEGGAELIRCVIVYEAKDSDSASNFGKPVAGRTPVKAGQLIECEVPWTEELEKRYQARLMAAEGLLIRKEQGSLNPYDVKGLDKGHWKCRSDKDGKSLYCPVGAIKGRCHE